MTQIIKKMELPQDLYDRSETQIAISQRIQEIKERLEEIMGLYNRKKGLIEAVTRMEARDLITELSLISSYTYGSDDFIRMCSAILLYNLKGPNQ